MNQQPNRPRAFFLFLFFFLMTLTVNIDVVSHVSGPAIFLPSTYSRDNKQRMPSSSGVETH